MSLEEFTKNIHGVWINDADGNSYEFNFETVPPKLIFLKDGEPNDDTILITNLKGNHLHLILDGEDCDLVYENDEKMGLKYKDRMISLHRKNNLQ